MDDQLLVETTFYVVPTNEYHLLESQKKATVKSDIRPAAFKTITHVCLQLWSSPNCTVCLV